MLSFLRIVGKLSATVFARMFLFAIVNESIFYVCFEVQAGHSMMFPSAVNDSSHS